MSTQIANFASCLGKYDGSVLSGAGTTLDPSSVAIRNFDLSLNSGYLSNPNAFTTPAVGNGTGFSVTGWFNPGGAQASNFTPIFDMSGASASATNHITLCVSGNSLTPALVATFNAQKSVYVPSGAVNANAWNFFGYTVCCSGNTQLLQNLMVNNTMTSVTDGSYAPLTVANTYVGYGVAPYNNYFQGKIDDFRYYNRCVTPMEMRVLYSYAYGKSTVSATAPNLGGSVTAAQSSATTAMITLPSSGTYSFLQMNRVGSNSTNYTTSISPSAMIASGASYVFSDAGLSNPVTYVYTLTPYILGTPGMSSIPFSVTMFSAPTAMAGLTASSFTATSGNWTGFTLAWAGGTGTGVSYSYYVNNVQVYPSGSAGSVVFTGLPTPSSSTTPTAYAWYVDVCANNLAGTAHGISTVYAPPTAITSVSISNAGIGVFDVTWVGGLGNSVTYLYDVSSSGAIVTPSGNYTTSVLTASSTRITLTNNAQKTYTVVVKASNVGGAVSSATSGSITTLSPTTVTFAGYSATTTSNGYSIFVYKASKTTAITFSGNITFYVLLVGGGGSGGCDQAGGGGAGGVLQSTITINSSDSISITIGAGGVAINTPTNNGNPGANSSFTFSTNTSSSITAIGGGRGCSYTSSSATNGGFGGGGGPSQYVSATPGTGTTGQGTSGGTGISVAGGGGGGANNVGGDGTGTTGGNGGNGKKCTLLGITSSSYGTYYWGGGGGGGFPGGGTGGNGGLGGGGGGQPIAVLQVP